MEKFWDIFKEITQIPHCSGKAEKLQQFIRNWGKQYGYSVKGDKAGNIIAYHPEATMTLQAHYDMVCMGEAPTINVIQKQGKMMATESSLGADNGIGVALMLEAMQEGLAVDCLFTADEEIGLIGAHALELEIKTSAVLNLDSEEDESVYIGCAGGLDMIATLPLQRKFIKDAKYVRYSIDNLPGGHSGIDIDKKIPNANIELAKKMGNYEMRLVDVKGGERRNSIAKSAEAVFILEGEVPAEFEELQESEYTHYYENSEAVINGLANMPHGVKKENKQFGIPHSSLNFATMKIEDHKLIVNLSLRSMDQYGMDVLEGQTKHYLESLGYSVKTEGYYAPWIADKSAFAQRLADRVEAVEGFVEFKAIHAGLECGVLQRKLPKVDFASIGPNIHHPHSVREYVDMGSVERFREIVHTFIVTEKTFHEEASQPKEQGTRNKRPRRR